MYEQIFTWMYENKITLEDLEYAANNLPPKEPISHEEWTDIVNLASDVLNFVLDVMKGNV